MMKMKKQWKCLLALGMTLTTMGGIGFAADGVQTTSYIVNADKFQLPYAGNEAAFNHKINPGYGSALALKSINKTAQWNSMPSPTAVLTATFQPM